MNYEFPLIRNVSDILPAIDGKSEFIVADRGDFLVANYVVSLPESFHMEGPDDLFGAIRRECRGIKFRKSTGDLIARPLHKFFNLGEKQETLLSNLDMSRPHVVMEKLDGCLDANTMIMTPDGLKTIKFLCETDYNGLILGANRSGEICWCVVFQTNILDISENWYEIETENGIKLKITGNHKVWCNDIGCYKKVEDLTGEEDLLFFEV